MRKFLAIPFLVYFFCLIISISLLFVSNSFDFNSRFSKALVSWNIDNSCTDGNQKKCFVYQNSSPRATVSLIGDSHMQQYFEEFKKIGKTENIDFVYVTDISQVLSTKVKPSVIMISEYHSFSSAQNLELYSQLLVRISNQKVPLLYIGDNPVFSDYLKYKHYINPSIFFQIAEKIGFKLVPDKFVDVNQINKNSQLAGQEYLEAAKKLANTIDPFTLFCNSSKCRRFQDGQWLYWDDHHLSVYGASLVAANIRKELLVLIQAS